MNYLLGSLRGSYAQTVGVVDLGGGSVQMAYAISPAAAANAPPASPEGDAYVFDKLILGTNYHLYTHRSNLLLHIMLELDLDSINTQLCFLSSYLNYGLRAARAQNLELSAGRGNPCVTNGYRGTYEYSGVVYDVAPPRSGTNLRRCRALSRKTLKVDAPCTQKNCSFNGVWNGGGGDGFDNLYVASYFYDTAAEVRNFIIPLANGEK